MNLTEQLTEKDLQVLFPTTNFDEYKWLALEKLQSIFDKGAIHICLRLEGHGDIIDAPDSHAHDKDLNVIDISRSARFWDWLSKLAYHYLPDFVVDRGGLLTIVLHDEDGVLSLGLSADYITYNQQFSYRND